MLQRWLHRGLSIAVIFASIPALTAHAQTTGCVGADASNSPPAAGAELNLGVEAYKNARYNEAMDHFEKATKLAPCFTIARSYLATAEAQNVVPGLDTPDNLKIAEQAIADFQILLAENQHDVNSLKQIAAIYFSIKKLDDAREWQKKILVEDPVDPEAAYTIGVIDWQQAHQNALTALTAVGMQDDGIGNVNAPPHVLESIKQKNNTLVTEALQFLNQALENRPKYDDAMAYMNLVNRRKADIDYQNPALRDDDIAKAKEWAHKAMQTRKESEEKKAASPDSSQP